MNQTSPTFDPLLWEALPDLNLNIAQTAELCGISVRQLGYWTRQGYVAAQGKGTRRTYGLDAVRRLLAIRKSMISGLSLRQSLRTLAESAPAATLAPALSDTALSEFPPALSPADTAALMQSLDSFFAANRNTRDHAGGLAIKLGRSEGDVQCAAEALCAAGILMSIPCQGMTIFRRAGQERNHV